LETENVTYNVLYGFPGQRHYTYTLIIVLTAKLYTVILLCKVIIETVTNNYMLRVMLTPVTQYLYFSQSTK